MFWLLILALLSVLVSAWVAGRLISCLWRYGWRKPTDTQKTDTLPSVSVCIPARNEAHAMSFCLERVLASDYEKLEVLVLDDNSDDDTSILIKSFAHAGVRFIAGKALPAGWLGKNHALDTMAREASGDIIMFLDVDTQIETGTISSLVRQFEATKSSVMSVLPQRRDVGRASVLFGHLRYFWEIVLSNRRIPASSSALWLIRRRNLLGDLDGLAAMHTHVQPEKTLAAWASRSGAYRLVLSRPALGVYYEKRWSSQRETSERLLFPLFTTSLAAVVLGVGCLTIWLSGLVAAIFVLAFFPEAWLYIVAMVLPGMLCYLLYLHLSWTGRRYIGVLFWPYVVLQEVYFALASVVKYATKTVTWKGRLVTAPGLNRQYLTLDE